MKTAPVSASEPQNRWLLLARVFTFLWLLFQVWRVVWYLPAFYHKLVNLEPNNGLPGWTPTEISLVLPSLGVTPQLLAGLLFAASLMCLLSFWAISGLLYWLKGNSWIGLLSAYILAGIGVGFSYLIPDTNSLPAWAQWLNDIQAVLLWPTFFLLLYLFPDGRFSPRWTRFLAPVPYLSFLAALWNGTDLAQGWLLGIVLALATGGLLSQVYRYRWISNPEQRLQTKWIVFALGVLISLLLAGEIAPLLLPTLTAKTPVNFLYDVIFNYILGALASALLPISIGISILRYRLWDIDLVIRRTLVYTVLSGLVALVYFGAVALLQQIFGAFGGQLPELAIIISTLGIAAMFSPLRRNVQSFIDRRFYRPKYNAEQTVAELAAVMRDEVSMDRITGMLVSAVEATLQPEQVWVWLNPVTSPGARRKVDEG